MEPAFLFYKPEPWPRTILFFGSSWGGFLGVVFPKLMLRRCAVAVLMCATLFSIFVIVDGLSLIYCSLSLI